MVKHIGSSSLGLVLCCWFPIYATCPLSIRNSI